MVWIFLMATSHGRSFYLMASIHVYIYIHKGCGCCCECNQHINQFLLSKSFLIIGIDNLIVFEMNQFLRFSRRGSARPHSSLVSLRALVHLPTSPLAIFYDRLYETILCHKRDAETEKEINRTRASSSLLLI